MNQSVLTSENAVDALEGSGGALVLSFNHGKLTEEVRYNNATNQFEHIIIAPDDTVHEYEQMNKRLAERLLSDKLDAKSMSFTFEKYSDSAFDFATSYPEDTFTR